MVLIVLRGLNGQNNEGVDRCLIKGLRTEKNGGQTPNKKEFSNKTWSVTSMNRLTKKIHNCRSTERKSGSGRPRCLRTADNVQ